MDWYPSHAMCFVDTNVIAYSYDSTDTDKRARAVDVVDRVLGVQAGVMSTQVLGELYVVLLAKVVPRLSPEDADEAVRTHAAIWPVEPVTSSAVLAALGQYRPTVCRTGTPSSGPRPWRAGHSASSPRTSSTGAWSKVSGF